MIETKIKLSKKDFKKYFNIKSNRIILYPFPEKYIKIFNEKHGFIRSTCVAYEVETCMSFIDEVIYTLTFNSKIKP